jgi:hypothetical protein
MGDGTITGRLGFRLRMSDVLMRVLSLLMSS